PASAAALTPGRSRAAPARPTPTAPRRWSGSRRSAAPAMMLSPSSPSCCPTKTNRTRNREEALSETKPHYLTLEGDHDEEDSDDRSGLAGQRVRLRPVLGGLLALLV